MLLTGKVPFVGFPMGRGTTNRMIFSALALLSRPGNSYQSFSALPCLIFFHSIYTTSMYGYWVGMGIRYRMGFTHSCRRSARLFSSVPWDKSFYGMFLSSVGLSLFCFLFFLVFDMPLPGPCSLRVFPEEGERSANLYRMETGTREERSPTSVSAGVLRMWYCFTRSQSQ